MAQPGRVLETHLLLLLELVHRDSILVHRHLHRGGDRQHWRGDERQQNVTGGREVSLASGQALHLLLQQQVELLLLAHVFEHLELLALAQFGDFPLVLLLHHFH